MFATVAVHQVNTKCLCTWDHRGDSGERERAARTLERKVECRVPGSAVQPIGRCGLASRCVGAFADNRWAVRCSCAISAAHGPTNRNVPRGVAIRAALRHCGCIIDLFPRSYCSSSVVAHSRHVGGEGQPGWDEAGIRQRLLRLESADYREREGAPPQGAMFLPAVECQRLPRRAGAERPRSERLHAAEDGGGSRR